MPVDALRKCREDAGSIPATSTIFLLIQKENVCQSLGDGGLWFRASYLKALQSRPRAGSRALERYALVAGVTAHPAGAG